MTTTPETTQVKKMFMAWQDEQEENWLRQMANQGWQLTEVNWGLYTFARTQPQDTIYRLDYVNTNDPAEKAAYIQLFADAGWEHAGETFGWQYFRRPAGAGGPTEIYTDNQSKIQKYWRVLGGLTVSLPLMIISLANLVLRAGTTAGVIVGAILSLALVVALVFVVQVFNRIQQLKRRI